MMTNKVNKESLNITSEIKGKLKDIMPEVFTEAEIETENGETKVEDKIDFGKLKEFLKNEISKKNETYSFNWAGKQEAIKNIQIPSYGTLIPNKDESIDFDDSENLFIEGDNLETLKLLQKSYDSKVKMIYIDPPYNTGGDFVYNDDFKDNIRNYLEKTGQVDSDGNKLTTNTESNGRFHSDWLSMMYPRLYLARNLLKEDGVIFISIDDNEVHNLKMIMNEIFGEENFISNLIWQKKTGASDAKGIATITEYVMVYTKNENYIKNIFTKNKDSYNLDRYRYKDEFYEERGPYYLDTLDRGGLQYSDSLNFGIECPDGTITFPNGRKEYKNDGWIWKWSKEKIKWARKNKFIDFRKSTNKESGWSVVYKNYLLVDNENNKIERAAPHKNLILDILNAHASSNIKNVFNENIFKYSKPVSLIKKLISFVNTKDEIILDFFAGSATTAHSILELNKEDNENRKFIMVQLPEPISKDSLSYKEGYETIADIAKERIRRVIKGYGDNDPIDEGFKVFKLGKSNYKVWEELEAGDVTVEDVEKQIKLFDDTLIEGYKDIDVLYEIIIKEGYSLNTKIKKLDVDEYDIYEIEDENKHLYVTLEEKIDDDIINKINIDNETLFICLDSALTDNDKINLSLKFNLKTI
ncbi:MAG: site-specific DNA-methyltransferase [bacterium]